MSLTTPSVIQKFLLNTYSVLGWAYSIDVTDTGAQS